jgi:transcriptional regulator with XRE-family HTH domain
MLVCKQCDAIQPDQKVDPLRLAYDKYRYKKGMLQPEKIRDIRERYGFSREAFAAVLGMSPASIYRYEGGGLQDDLHDSMIFACEDASTMRRLVERRRYQLTPLQGDRFDDAMSKLRATVAAEQLPEAWLGWLESFYKEKWKSPGASTRSPLAAAASEYVRRLGPSVDHSLPHLLFLTELMSTQRSGETISGTDLRHWIAYHVDAQTLAASGASAETNAKWHDELWSFEKSASSLQKLQSSLVEEIAQPLRGLADDTLQRTLVERIRDALSKESTLLAELDRLYFRSANSPPVLSHSRRHQWLLKDERALKGSR